MIDTHRLNRSDTVTVMPAALDAGGSHSHCYSDACRQGRHSCPTPLACQLAEGDRVEFDDRPRDYTAFWGAAAILGTLGGVLFLFWQIARMV